VSRSRIGSTVSASRAFDRSNLGSVNGVIVLYVAQLSPALIRFSDGLELDYEDLPEYRAISSHHGLSAEKTRLQSARDYSITSATLILLMVWPRGNRTWCFLFR